MRLAVDKLKIEGLHRAVGGDLGGDWCSVWSIDDEVFFVIGDAPGHGRAAAMSVPTLREMLRAAVSQSTGSPADALRAANLVACRTSCESFSALIAAYRPSTASLTVAAAGHPAPIVARHDFAVALPVDGVLLGVDADAQYHDVELPLCGGDRVLLYTDGLIEANKTPTEGEKMLVEQFSRNVSARRMMDDLVPPDPVDDVGLLRLEYATCTPSERAADASG